MDTRTSICKIGMTGDKLTRIKSLKNGCSSPGDMVHEIIEVDDRVEAENYLHRLFHEKRLHGEWFKEVTFDMWREALLEYIDRKKKSPKDNIAFYKFLYSTCFETIHPIPIRILDEIKVREYQIMVFLGKDSRVGSVFQEKMDNILSRIYIPGRTRIILSCPTSHAVQVLVSYQRYSRMDIRVRNFGDLYERGEIKFTDMCVDYLSYCYGLVVFCHEENWVISKLAEYSKANDVKYRKVKTEAKSEHAKKEIVRKLRVA